MTKRLLGALYFPQCWCEKPWTRTCAHQNEMWDGQEPGAHFKQAYIQVEVPVFCSCGKELWECNDYKAFKKGHIFDKSSYRPVGTRRLGLDFIFNHEGKALEGIVNNKTSSSNGGGAGGK